MNYGNINTLIEMNNNLEKANMEANKARIHNPAGEIEGALANFLTARLNQVENDANFGDMIRSAIMARIEEASFKELTGLLHSVSMDNNRAAEGISKLFVSESAGKTVMDAFRDNDTETVAQQLYASTNNREILQAVTYLGAVLSKMSAESNIVEVAEEKTN